LVSDQSFTDWWTVGEAQIGKARFRARYIELIQALPGLEIGKPKLGPKPLPFRFKGGEGLPMPLLGPS
jgi:hypothetical protein